MANFKCTAISFGWFVKLKSVSTSPYLLVTSFHIQKIASKKTARLHLGLQIISLELEQRWIRKCPDSWQTWDLSGRLQKTEPSWRFYGKWVWQRAQRCKGIIQPIFQQTPPTMLHLGIILVPLSLTQSQLPLLNAMLICPRVLSISGQVTSRSRSVSLCQKSFGVIIPQWEPEDLHRRMKGSRERRKQLWPSQEPLKYDSLTQQEALQAPGHYAPSQPESGSNSTGVSGNEDSLVQFHLDSLGYKLC